jgi:hypothetical protein
MITPYRSSSSANSLKNLNYFSGVCTALQPAVRATVFNKVSSKDNPQRTCLFLRADVVKG